MLYELVLGAAQEAVGPVGQPGVVRGDMVGHVVEEQAEAPLGELPARRRQRDGTAEAVVDDVVAHAVRRADHVLGAEVRQRRAVAGVETGILERDVQAGRAALPHAHEPHRVDAQRGERVPGRARHLVEPQRAAPVAPEPLEPHRGVDLVDGGPGRQAHGAGAHPSTALAAPGRAWTPPPSRSSTATVPVQPV